MNKVSRHSIIRATTAGLATGIVAMCCVSVVSAWTAPTLAPPSGNASAPINQSATYQDKAGPLTVYSLGTTALGGNAFLVPAGNVGIGTLAPAYTLDVAGDVNGTRLCIAGDCQSTWPTGGGGGGSLTNSAAAGYIPKSNSATVLGQSVIFQDASGNIGIGRTDPVKKLDINGGLNVSGGITALGDTTTNGVHTVGDIDVGDMLHVHNNIDATGATFSASVAAASVNASGNINAGVNLTAGARMTAGADVTTTGGKFCVGDNNHCSDQLFGGMYAKEGATCTAVNDNTGACTCPAGTAVIHTMHISTSIPTLVIAYCSNN